MKTYSTYQECKIANPECDVFAYDGKFYAGKVGDICIDMKPANHCEPASYCMTVEKFLKDGYKFVEGDLFIAHTGTVVEVYYPQRGANNPDSLDCDRYVLRAAALEEKPRTKVEFVKVEDSIFDLRDDFENGELYCKNLSSSDDYQKLNTEVALFGCAAAGNIYRRIETQITEREAFIDEMARFAQPSVLGKMYDAGCRFVN